MAICPGFWIRADLAAQERGGRSADQEPRVLVEGAVVDHETGDPVPGATVSLGAGPSGTRGRGTRVADEEGRFQFEGVPVGAYRLWVTAQGYRDMNDTLEVSGERDLDLILPLSTSDVRLEPIHAPAARSPMAMRGYEARRRSGGGFLVTREEIRRRRPRYLTELLHRVPGGMVVPTPPQGYTLLLRDQCRPGIWMDGVLIPGAPSIDQLLSPLDAEAVEVYHGFELPAEFGVNPCGGVLVWTRRGAPPPPGAESSGSEVLGALVKVAALLAVILVLAR